MGLVNESAMQCFGVIYKEEEFLFMKEPGITHRSQLMNTAVASHA